MTSRPRTRDRARPNMVWLIIAGLAVLGGDQALAACGDDEAATRPTTTQTEHPEPETADTEGTEPDIHPDGALDAAEMEMSDPLRIPSANFGVEDFGNAGRLEYTGDAYRMASQGRPVFSPLQDRQVAGLTSAVVSVELTTVSGFGTAGLTCGVDREGSYMFTVARNEMGATSVVIGYYEMATGMPASANQSRPGEGVRRLQLPPLGEPMTIGAICEPADQPAEAQLTMTLNGREVLSITADRGSPEGQVGMFNWGQGPEFLITDFTTFTASGSLASDT